MKSRKTRSWGFKKETYDIMLRTGSTSKGYYGAENRKLSRVFYFSWKNEEELVKMKGFMWKNP